MRTLRMIAIRPKMNYRRLAKIESPFFRASKLGRLVVLFCVICLVAGYVASPLAADEGADTRETTPSAIGLPSIIAEPADLNAQSVIGRARTKEILTAFYRATGGENWTKNTNWLSEKSVRTWFGVTATSSGRVEKIILSDNGLKGEIPAVLGELDSLRLIDFGFNQLTGTIPPELGNLSLMYHLHLGSNQLTGTIPPELANISKLKSLDLFENNLEGQIPPELGTPPRFHLLRLDGNVLTGPIPSTLGQLGRLKYLRLENNLLTGKIPPELGDLLRLENLQLDNNELTGPIPSEIGNLIRLRTLTLGSNELSGPLPPELGNIPRMLNFTVYDNSLSGPIPPQLHSWNKLRWVWIRGNQLSGCLPAHWDDLQYNDFGHSGLEFCDFGLPHLDVGPGSLDPAYSPLLDEFALRVGIDTERITLHPFFGPATVVIKDARGRAARDADLAQTGHQITLPKREAISRYTIEYKQDSQTATYVVNVIRRFQGRITVLDNRFVEAPGNDELKHNIPDLEVEMDGATLFADFLSHYDRTGGRTRWGFPTSEVLVLEPKSLTQFYQRGVVDFHNLGAGWVVERRLAWDYVGGGLAGSPDLGVEIDITNRNPGSVIGPWRHRVSNIAVDGTHVGFADFFRELGGVAAFGFPKTDARVDIAGAGRILAPGATPGFIRQYFQSAVLEFHPNDERDPIKLSLLGDTLRNRLVPNHQELAAFSRAREVLKDAAYVPLIAASFSGIAPDPAPIRQPEPPALGQNGAAAPEEELNALVEGNTAFAVDLYSHVKDGRENLIFSPYSISQAFAMAIAGASGETEVQLRDALRFPLGQDRLHPTFSALVAAVLGTRDVELPPLEGEFELNIANSLWLQRDFAFTQDFLDVLDLHYGVGPNAVDFKFGHEAARRVINAWVANETQDRIMDLLQPGILDEFTRLVLVNAIYFKAGWAYPFVDESTRPMRFYLLGGGNVLSDLMNVRAPLGYWRGNEFVAVELPYKFERQHMLLIVPDRGRFEEVEQTLSAELIGQIDEELSRAQLNVWLPKFEFETQLSLADAIKELGAPDAFDRARAEFENINGLSCLKEEEDCLYIKDAIHKAFIAVDEDGTEAAAATAIVFATPTSSDPGPQPTLVRIDRPFMFFIRDNATDSTLFAGRVVDPR